jgi:hypothetical protein
MVLLLTGCRMDQNSNRSRYMPGGTVPDKLWVYAIGAEHDRDLKNTLYCLQGLVNRKVTRIDYVERAMDRFSPDEVEVVVAVDHLLFTTIWNSMSMVKNALETRGHYVHHKPSAARLFAQTFHAIPDAEVILELHDMWQLWPQIHPEYEAARKYTARLRALALRLDACI